MTNPNKVIQKENGCPYSGNDWARVPGTDKLEVEVDLNRDGTLDKISSFVCIRKKEINPGQNRVTGFEAVIDGVTVATEHYSWHFLTDITWDVPGIRFYSNDQSRYLEIQRSRQNRDTDVVPVEKVRILIDTTPPSEDKKANVAVKGILFLLGGSTFVKLNGF